MRSQCHRRIRRWERKRDEGRDFLATDLGSLVSSGVSRRHPESSFGKVGRPIDRPGLGFLPSQLT